MIFVSRLRANSPRSTEMPAVRPPRDCPSTDGPKFATLPAGTVLWRVHTDSRDPVAFRTTGAEQKRADPRTHGREGRFDCQRGEYGYLYVGETRSATIAEAFLRDDVVRDPTARLIARRPVVRAALSRIELTDQLVLVDLRGAEGLTRLGQDAWLTSSEEVDFPITQAWATAVRRWAPNAHGMMWMAKRDNTHFAAVLFDDRGTAARIRGEVVRRFAEDRHFAYVTKVLAALNVKVS